MPTMRCLSMVSSPWLSGTEQPVGPLPGPGLVLLLCWPQQPRSAVAPAPRTSVPTRGPKTGRRRQPTWSATRPATPAARPGMTDRDERKRASTDQTTHIAEYLRLAAIRDWRRVAHISARSGSRRGPAGLLGQLRGHVPAVRRTWLTFMTRPHCARYRPRSGRRPAGRGRGRRRRRAAACASPADEP